MYPKVHPTHGTLEIYKATRLPTCPPQLSSATGTKEFVACPYFPRTSQILTQAPGPSYPMSSGHLFLIFNLRIPSPRCAHRRTGGHVCICAEASGWHPSSCQSRPYSFEVEYLLEPEVSIFISAGSQQAPLVSCLHPPQCRQGL